MVNAGGRLLVHVPLAGSAARQKEGRAATRRSTTPGTLITGTMLHVHVDQATVQLSNGIVLACCYCSSLELLC